jgi:hypothetical protein
MSDPGVIQICFDLHRRAKTLKKEGAILSSDMIKLLEVCKGSADDVVKTPQSPIENEVSSDNSMTSPSAKGDTVHNDSSIHHHCSNRTKEDYLFALHKHCTNSLFHELIHENAGYQYRIDPYPHAVFERLFPNDVLDAISEEVPDAPVIDKNKCSKQRICRDNGKCEYIVHTCIRDHIQSGKSGFRDELFFGPATLAMFSFIRSSRFLRFLQKITGIKGLLLLKDYGCSVYSYSVLNSISIHI